MPDPAPATRESTIAAPAPSPALWPRPRQALALLGCYFALQVVLRVAFSSSVDLDESEQVVLGQKLCWGYGSDPPLYTWIQVPFFRLFGESVFALSLLKNFLLFTTYWLTFVTARLVTRSPAAAIAAAFSLLFLPEVSWESQRDLTHTILAALLALVSLYCLLRLFEQRQTRWYLLFGLSVGLGLLSKFNYVFWPLALVAAAASLPELRPAIKDWRLLLALLLAITVFLPNGFWMLSHRDLALFTASKFEAHQAQSWFSAVTLGCKHLFQSVLNFGAPLPLIYLLIFWKAPRQLPAPDRSRVIYRTLMLRAWLIIGVVLVATVLCARATGFRQRWFQPILIALPIVAVMFIQNRLDRTRLKIIAGVGVFIMVSVAIVMPGRLLLAQRLKREEPLTHPYAQLARQLQSAIPEDSLLVCDTRRQRALAGNLRLVLPQRLVLTPELTSVMSEPRAHCFLVWDATGDSVMPTELVQWAATSNQKSATNMPVQHYSAIYRFHAEKRFRLAVTQLY